VKEEDRKRDNLDVLYVGCRDKPELLVKYADEHGMKPMAIDAGDKVVDRFDIRSGAGIVLIRRDGLLRTKLDAQFSEQRLREHIDAGLAPDPVPPDAKGSAGPKS